MVFIILLLIIPFYGYFKREQIKSHIQNVTHYLNNQQHKARSYLLFVTVVVILNIALSSSTITNLLAGHLYGIWTGSVLTTIGLLISTIISFAIGKGMKKDILRNKSVKQFYNMVNNKSISKFDITKLVFLSRLPPIFPYQLFTYFWSFQDINFVLFITGSMLGAIPGIVFETYLGTKSVNIDKIFEKNMIKKNKIEYAVITIIILYMIYLTVKGL